MSSAIRAIVAETSPQPPIGWKTPCSYSRNDRIEKRLGQRNGDMPRYFDWNVKARRIRSSEKNRPSSESKLFHGLSRGTSFSKSGFAKSVHRSNGFSRNGANRTNFSLVSVMNRVNAPRSLGERRATASSILSRSGVAKRSPPEPKMRRYCGSSLTISTSLLRSYPHAEKMSARTLG